MGFFEFVGAYWWLVFPLGAVFGSSAGAAVKNLRKWDERRRRDRIELARIKYGARTAAAEHETAAPTAFARTRARHKAVDARWLHYELDVGALIDYPLITDMREPLTVDFHRARRDAESALPLDPDGVLTAPADLAAYADAVRRYETAFDRAEQEARRRRASDFSPAEQQALVRAKRFLALAEDPAAGHAERQSAYRRATRELEGLVVLPTAATDALEQRIAGALDAPPAAGDATTA